MLTTFFCSKTSPGHFDIRTVKNPGKWMKAMGHLFAAVAQDKKRSCFVEMAL